MPSHPNPHAAAPRDTTRSWQLLGDNLPAITRTVTVAEAARAMVIRGFGRKYGQDRMPDGLHGPGHPGSGPHSHAYWLPEDRDRDGRIDHLTIHTPAGFDIRSASVLTDPGPLIVDHAGKYRLRRVREQNAGAEATCAWVSATPFIGPRHSFRNHPDRPRASRSAAAQLAFELARMRDPLGQSLPRARIIPMDRRSQPPLHAFTLATRFRADLTRPVRDWLAIEFETPVSGPLAVGLAAHFGMGQFKPFWEAS